MLRPPARAGGADAEKTSAAGAARSRLKRFAAGAATWAALETGLLEALLDDPPCAAPELAWALELDPAMVERVLQVLAAAGLAVRTRGGAGWRAGPALAALATHDPAFVRTELEVWRHLPAALRTGEPLSDAGTLGERERTYARIADDLAVLAREPARRLAGALGSVRGPILDAGCGAGVWSLALARRNAGVRVVGVDLPAVVRRFLARARELGMEDRVEARAGDLHEAELEAGGYGLVVAANVLRLEAPVRARSLLSRLAEAVAPGGSLLVVDALPGDARAARTVHAAYRLHLALRTPDGDTLDPCDLAAWLRAEGLVRVERIGLGEGALHGAVLARREGRWSASAGG